MWLIIYHYLLSTNRYLLVLICFTVTFPWIQIHISSVVFSLDTFNPTMSQMPLTILPKLLSAPSGPFLLTISVSQQHCCCVIISKVKGILGTQSSQLHLRSHSFIYLLPLHFINPFLEVHFLLSLTSAIQLSPANLKWQTQTGSTEIMNSLFHNVCFWGYA